MNVKWSICHSSLRIRKQLFTLKHYNEPDNFFFDNSSIFSSIQNELMEESEDTLQHREEMIRMYHSTKEALEIVSDIDSHTSATPLPPPIASDDMDYKPTPSPQISRRPASGGYSSRPTAPSRPAPARPDNVPSVPRYRIF